MNIAMPTSPTILSGSSLTDAPGEVYFDSATGTRKRRSTPLKSAVQAAAEAPAPLAPPPPPPPPPKFVPLASDVAKRATVSGTVAQNVPGELEQNDLASFFVELQQFDAAAAAEVKDLHDSGHANLRLASEKLKMKQSAYNELKNSIVVLAELRKEIAGTAAELVGVCATLDDPACLTMDAADLLKLELKRKHLPSKITSLEQQADAEAASVKALFAKSGLDGEKVLGHMRRGSGYGGDGRTILDGHIHELFQQGYIRLPE